MRKKIACLTLAAFLSATSFAVADAASLSATDLFSERMSIDNAMIKNPFDANQYIKRGNVNLLLFSMGMGQANGNNAKEDFDRALKLNAECADAYYGLGEYFRLAGVLAVQYLPLATEQYLTEKLGNVQYSSEMSRNIAKKSALFAYSMAICTAKNDTSKFYIARGDMHRDMNDTAAAIADYTAAINDDKQNFFALLKRGIINCDSGYAEQGIEDCTVAINLLNNFDKKNSYDVIRAIPPNLKGEPEYVKPTYADLLFVAYSTRGNALQRTGQSEEAITDFSNVLALQPNNEEYLLKRAELYEATKQYDKAIADFDKILLTDSNNKSVKNLRKETLKAKKAYDKEMKNAAKQKERRA